MERIASLPKPEGFFDPKAPAGKPTPPERAPTPRAARRRPRRGAPAAPATPPAPRPSIRSRRTGSASRTPISRSAATMSSSATFTGSTPTTSSARTSRSCCASVVCPGGQGDVSVHGNLLFMSVEQTRGRLDCGTQGVQTPVSAERFRGVRIFDITDVNKPKQVAAMQTLPRLAHAHAGDRPERQGEPLRLRIRHELGAVGRGARRLLRPRSQGGSEHGALQHRRHPGAARRAAEREDRQPAAHLRRPGDRHIAGLWQGGDHGPGTQTSR